MAWMAMAVFTGGDSFGDRWDSGVYCPRRSDLESEVADEGRAAVAGEPGVGGGSHQARYADSGSAHQRACVDVQPDVLLVCDGALWGELLVAYDYQIDWGDGFVCDWGFVGDSVCG